MSRSLLTQGSRHLPPRLILGVGQKDELPRTMKVFFGQIYVQPEVTFPFTLHFQRRLSEDVTALIESSATFAKKFGLDWTLMFRISAKRCLLHTEIRGPVVYRKDKSVEFTLFLPFDALQREPDVERAAMRALLNGACEVLVTLGIDAAKVEEKKESLIESFCSDPAMFKRRSPTSRSSLTG